MKLSKICRAHHASMPPHQAAELGRRDELELLLQEWISVRNQGDGALAGQLSAMGLGTAAISVLIAGIASAWSRAPLFACAGLMVVVPSATFFVLLLWATEIKKTLRASSFLRVLEKRINQMFPETPGGVLTWESTGYQYGRIVAYYTAIAASLLTLAVVSYAVGAVKFLRIKNGQHGWLWASWWPIVLGLAVGVPALIAGLYIAHESRLNFAERV